MALPPVDSQFKTIVEVSVELAIDAEARNSDASARTKAKTPLKPFVSAAPKQVPHAASAHSSVRVDLAHPILTLSMGANQKKVGNPPDLLSIPPATTAFSIAGRVKGRTGVETETGALVKC